MDELDRGGAFAACGGHPFDRPMADVSAAKTPGMLVSAAAGGGRCSGQPGDTPRRSRSRGQYIAPVVERDGAGEPARARLGPDQDEQR